MTVTAVDLAPAGAPFRTLDTTTAPGDFVVVHSLTTVAGVCLNRDMDGLPKSMLYGGTERLRVSSQSLIRAAREWIRTHTVSGEQGASSRLLPQQTALCLQNRGIDPADAVPAALLAVVAAGMSVDPAEPGKTRAMTYVSAGAPDRLAQVALTYWDDSGIQRNEMEERITAGMAVGPRARGRKRPPQDDSGPAPDLADSLPIPMIAAARDAFAPGLSLEIALFGRFLTEIPGGRIPSAANVAHALSVDPHVLLTDDFTAVDDWQTGGVFGVGMLGAQHLSSGTLYRWACLNRRTLRTNLAASGAEESQVEEAARRAEQLFTTAITYTLPKARSSRTGSAALPTLAIAATSDVPLTAAAAFETPIEPPAGEEAAARLAAYLTSAGRLLGGTARWLSPTGSDAPGLPSVLTVEGH